MDTSRGLVVDTVNSTGVDLSNCANKYVQLTAIFAVSERPLPNVLHSVSSAMARDSGNKYMGYSACSD
ncbi:hypothetical protein [Aliiglaciecola litoralis]